jgi:hypothetical protein
MKFFTFCVDINKTNKKDLNRTLKLLIQSMDYNLDDYELVVYTNYDIDCNNRKVKFRNYHYGTLNRLYDENVHNNEWLNLSFNKINIYKELYDEFKEDYVWIDLDTIVVHDISYIDNLDSFFVEIGGQCADKNMLFSNNISIAIPRKRYIQGNFWKLNMELYDNLIECLDELKNKNLQLRYDLQDLFSYYIYIKKEGELNKINIIGYNYLPNALTGLSIWSELGNTHATYDGLNSLYFDDDILKTIFYPDKDIHIVSFTFNTLKKLWDMDKFKEIFAFPQQLQ